MDKHSGKKSIWNTVSSHLSLPLQNPKKITSSNNIMRYFPLVIILIIFILSMLLIKKNNEMKDITSKISQIETEHVILESKMKQEVEYVMAEKDMKRALQNEYQELETNVLTKVQRKDALNKALDTHKKEEDYILIYLKEINAEIGRAKNTNEDLVKTRQQLKNKNTQLEIILDSYRKDSGIKKNDGSDNSVGSSLLLNSEDIQFLQSQTVMRILYRCYSSTHHGLSPSRFHELCDNIGPTLFIVKIDNGSVLGGYTKESWDSQEVKRDSTAMIFNVSTKQAFNVFSPANAITTSPNKFIQFGKDLVITRLVGNSEFPSSYGTITKDNQSVFPKMFSVAIIEVYQMAQLYKPR